MTTINEDFAIGGTLIMTGGDTALGSIAMETRESLENAFETVKRYRDELRVQLHLAGAEARDEWNELEQKWDDLNRKFKAVRTTADESSEDVGAAAGMLAEELKKGYAAIRAQLR